MKVEQDGKTLYHMQNTVMGSDGVPFDVFVWCDHYPTIDDCRKAFELEYADGYSDDKEAYDQAMQDWLDNLTVYIIYAEEL